MNKSLALVNRRYLRVKVFQALYALQRSDDADSQRHERAIFESINKLYDLYLYLLKALMDMHDVASEIIEQNKRKKLPTPEDLNPNMRFVNNRVFQVFKSNEVYNHLVEKQKISWTDEHDVLRKIFKSFRETDMYRLYMAREDVNFQNDKNVLIDLFTSQIALNEVIHNSLEEKDIYWQDDLPMAAITVIKTLQQLPDTTEPRASILADLYKDKEEDQRFIKELFRKTLQFDKEYEQLIASKAENWEIERIAHLDMLLMKMALTELEHFATVPVKVTLNEYIELAKAYSTPKSKIFINGVLDKLVAELKASGRIQKRGRGLIE
ncbi:MAG: transcription antitermination factor NusB [Salibacteraceae bacterium]